MNKSDKKRVLYEVSKKLENAKDTCSTPQEYYTKLTEIDTDELLNVGYNGIAKDIHRLQNKCYDMQEDGFKDWGDVPERTVGLFNKVRKIAESIRINCVI